MVDPRMRGVIQTLRRDPFHSVIARAEVVFLCPKRKIAAHTRTGVLMFTYN